MFYGFEVGPDVLINTSKGSYGDDFALSIHGAGKIGYSFDKLKIFTEITILTNLTMDINDFGDRFINHFGVGASYTFNQFEVGLNFNSSFNRNISIDKGIGLKFKYFGF